MNTEPVKVSVTLSADDYYMFFKTYSAKATYILHISIMAILSIIIIAITWRSLVLTIILISVIVIATIFLLTQIPKNLKKTSLRQYESNKLIQQEHVYTINSCEIEVYSATGQSRISWESFHKYKETDTAFLIFLSQNQSYYIPKKSFTDSDTQIPLLREYLKNIKIE